MKPSTLKPLFPWFYLRKSRDLLGTQQDQVSIQLRNRSNLLLKMEFKNEILNIRVFDKKHTIRRQFLYKVRYLFESLIAYEATDAAVEFKDAHGVRHRHSLSANDSN